MRAVAIAVLVLGITFTDSAIAFAATTATAGSLDEVTQIVSQAGVNREDKVVINYTGDPSDLDPIKASINNYNPFVFLYGWLLQKDDPTTSNDADYLVGNMEYSNPNYNITFDMKKRELIFNLEYFETLEQTEYVNTHVPEILNSIGMEGKSNYEKVKGIHDYVCDLITYDNESENCNSMYGAIVDQLALCNAYSLCMYKLCVEAGIPCKYIGGYAGTGRDAGGHAWNIVALGDKWYYLDATWDDGDEIVYDYFLKGTEDFDEADPTQGHYKDDPYYESPFKDTFPISRTAFEEGDPDENTLITVAGTNPGNPDPEVTYQASELIEETIPANKKINVKKNKKEYLFVLFKDERAAAIVNTFMYKITKGKKFFKKPDALECGIVEDEGLYYAYVGYKGKKKGNVGITMTFLLANGQMFDVKFSGKIKN